MPGDREQDATVIGPRDQERGLTGQERPVEDQMRPLARRQERRGAGIIELPERVGIHTGRVDHRAGVDLERLASLLVFQRKRR